MNPKVSVCIPCHNSRDYVGAAIDSALAQTWPQTEVVVVDDGSTDGTADIIKAYGNRITSHVQPQRGACAARNAALQLARGEFIQFLDADDLLMPHKLALQMPALMQNQADLVFSRGTLFGDDKPERPIKRPTAKPDGQDPFLYFLAHGIGTESALHRRTCLELVGGFREGLPRMQEVDLHLRLAAANVRILFLDQLTHRHRNHPSPDRITRKPSPPDEKLSILLGLLHALESGSPYDFNSSRRRAFASHLAQSAIYAYRNGAPDLAVKAFRLATKTHPRTIVAERPWYRLAIRLLPFARIEQALLIARTLKGRLKKSAPTTASTP